MKSVLAILVLLLLGFSPNQATAHEGKEGLVVGTGPSCPGADYSHVQDAINAAPYAAHIRVCPGLYDETISIVTSVHLTGDPGAIIMPSHLLPNATSLATGASLSAILRANNADEVTVAGITFDAGAASITQCSPDLIGILFQNSSGEIKQNIVRDTKLGANIDGCQSGLGIFVQSGNGGTSEVSIAENVVTDYQKNGITANELGTTTTIRDNTLIGLGSTTGAAQNGIQVGYGAAGEVVHNFVGSHIWAPCVSPTQCQFFSTGILIEQSDHIEIDGNEVGNNQINIFVNGRDAHLTGNKLYGSVVLDSIQILGDDSRVEWNRIVSSARAGVAVLANNVTVRENKFINAPVGIFKTSTAFGLKRDGNVFIDVAEIYADPAPSAVISGTHKPVR
jgi:hypothetical protein